MKLSLCLVCTVTEETRARAAITIQALVCCDSSAIMAGFVVLSELSLESQRGLPREPVLEGNFVPPAFVLTQGEVDRVYVAELHPDAVGGTFERGAPKRELLLVQLLEEVDVFAATANQPETWFPARFLTQRGPIIWIFNVVRAILLKRACVRADSVHFFGSKKALRRGRCGAALFCDGWLGGGRGAWVWLLLLCSGALRAGVLPQNLQACGKDSYGRLWNANSVQS